MKGPVAKAGSILYLFKIRGIYVPNNPAYRKTDINEIPIVSARSISFSVIRQNNNAINEQINPFTIATNSSLINFFAIVSISSELFANDWTIIAED